MHIKFEESKQKLSAAVQHLQSQLSSIRAGRANPQLVENILVSAYGQKVPLKQIANIAVVDASLITVKPWDKGNTETVYKDLSASDIGINPILDGDLIRLPVPQLTEERRQEYVKLMKNMLEDARISVRQVRKDIIIGMEQQLDAKQITEDQMKANEKQLQQMVDEANNQIEEIGKEKEKELLSV